jgi:hypothetical protein
MEQALQQWTCRAFITYRLLAGSPRIRDRSKIKSIRHELGYLFADAMTFLILASISSVM